MEGLKWISAHICSLHVCVSVCVSVGVCVCECVCVRERVCVVVSDWL